MSLFNKGLILISIPLLYELGYIGLVARMHWRSSQALARSAQSREVLVQAITLLGDLADAETGIRGFALSAKAAFAAPYERARKEAPHRIRRLQVVGGTEQLTTSAATVLSWLAESERLLQAGERQQAVAREKSGEGKRLMDAFRQQVTAFLGEEERLERQRAADVERAQEQFLWLFLAGGLVALVTTALLAWVFRRGISNRFATLMGNTRQLARGGRLAPLLAGTDEIAALDRVFHEMAQALAEAAQRERANTVTLERRVAERTAELAEANRDLLHKNQENETFVSSVSHDLRSPLVNLEGFSQELALSCADLRSLFDDQQVPAGVRQQGLTLLDRDVSESIRFIQTAVRRLSNIIDALLRLSRAGRVDYQRQSVDLPALVERVVRSLQGTIERRGATVVVRRLPLLWGDPTAFEQIFANLIGNALNYLDPTRNGVIEVGSLQPGEQGSLEGFQTCYVKDNGLGIAAAHQDKIFQAFQRAHADVAPGEGMGLAIVRRLVERHRGKVWVESQPGQGSTFFVTLLGSAATSAPAPRTATVQPSRSQGGKHED